MKLQKLVHENKTRLVSVIKDLATEYQVTPDEMLMLLQASHHDYKTIEGFDNYEIHQLSNVIRNKGTRRILRPNRNRQVCLRNGSIKKWVKQGIDLCKQGGK
ncbi:hypothetical protein [Vibrio breoganii]|uniref:hypothetical protein n=1 Tax=Vibrio breoganii TaxID=553239 RepID=UPI000C859E84|nr:hypothetical protein [Vibrio breoganii]PMG06844.1 hypothetical protein BCV08_04730 [Vibrio breoganii]PMH15776.1 hypothetical protein BCU74_14075 [Vibrio breoganii]PMM11044.1 hypothetical protein BCT60_16945 [Vibrio breoganii]TKG21748.1 hypothetical protein FCV81_08840 [Vibrio breoganii]